MISLHCAYLAAAAQIETRGNTLPIRSRRGTTTCVRAGNAERAVDRENPGFAPRVLLHTPGTCIRTPSPGRRRTQRQADRPSCRRGRSASEASAWTWGSLSGDDATRAGQTSFRSHDLMSRDGPAPAEYGWSRTTEQGSMDPWQTARLKLDRKRIVRIGHFSRRVRYRQRTHTTNS